MLSIDAERESVVTAQVEGSPLTSHIDMFESTASMVSISDSCTNLTIVRSLLFRWFFYVFFGVVKAST